MRETLRPTVGLLCLAVSIAGLVGCGDDGGDEAQGDGIVAPIDQGPVIAQLEPMEAIPSARVRGVLTLDQGCLLLDDPGDTDASAHVAVLLWPAGTTWDVEDRTVVVDDRNRYRVGGKVDGGGGYYEPNTDMTWLLGEEQSAEAAACASSTGAQSLALVFPLDYGTG